MIGMVRLPTPTAREVRWAFYVVAACALALVVTICWAIVHKVDQSDDIVHVAAANAAQVNRLSNQLDAQAKQLDALKHQAAADARIAAKERATLRRQNRAYLDYLRRLGIPIPQAAAPQSAPGTVTRPKAAPAHPSPHPSTPASPAPTATPAPSPHGPDVLCTFAPLTCP
jgi:hypothetical protein